ncbi:tail spike protein [Burkholderia phage vB_BpP_HN04]
MSCDDNVIQLYPFFKGPKGDTGSATQEALDAAAAAQASATLAENAATSAIAASTPRVANYTALRQYTGTADALIVTDVLTGGLFVRATGTDDGGVFLTTNSGKTFRRQFSGVIQLQWYGDSDFAANIAMKTAKSLGIGEVHFTGTLKVFTGIKLVSTVTLVGSGAASSQIVTQAGFAGNVVETENFDAIQATQPAGTADGCPISYGVESCTVNGAVFSGQPTDKTGYGVRIYGRMLRLKSLVIGKTAGIGLYTEFPAIPAYTNFDSITDSKFSEIRDIEVLETGMEGFIFNGPTDQYLDNIFVGWPGGSRFDTFDATGPKQSKLFPGDPIHGIRLLRSCEVGFIHSYDNEYGYAVHIERKAGNPSIRFRANYLMGENSYGNVFIGDAVRYNINLLETHSNRRGPVKGGPNDALAGANPQVKIISTLGGQAKIDVFRDAPENGSLGIHLVGSDHDIAAQVYGYSNAFTGGGKGFLNEASSSKIKATVVSKRDANTMQVGYEEASTTVRNDLDVSARFCDMNINLPGGVNADIGTIYRLRSDRPVTTAFGNLGRLGPRMYSIADISSYDGTDNFSNKFVGYGAIDLSSTAVQTVTLSHKLVRTPNREDVSLTFSYESGSIPPIAWMAVIGTNSTSITAQIKFASAGTGTGKLAISV